MVIIFLCDHDFKQENIFFSAKYSQLLQNANLFHNYKIPQWFSLQNFPCER